MNFLWKFGKISTLSLSLSLSLSEFEEFDGLILSLWISGANVGELSSAWTKLRVYTIFVWIVWDFCWDWLWWIFCVCEEEESCCVCVRWFQKWRVLLLVRRRRNLSTMMPPSSCVCEKQCIRRSHFFFRFCEHHKICFRVSSSGQGKRDEQHIERGSYKYK